VFSCRRPSANTATLPLLPGSPRTPPPSFTSGLTDKAGHVIKRILNPGFLEVKWHHIMLRAKIIRTHLHYRQLHQHIPRGTEYQRVRQR